MFIIVKRELRTLTETNNSEAEWHSIPKINWDWFRGGRKKNWGSFRGRYHFGVNLKIDHFGVGIISGAVRVLEHSLLSTELYNDVPRRSLGTFAHWHTNNIKNLNKGLYL